LSFTAVTPVHHTPMFILLSFVLLVVLINCMDFSSRRATTALSVHQDRRLCCINLDGHLIYRYDISGGGLAVDQQGHVYIRGCDSHDIHRLSPDGTFRDIVLSIGKMAETESLLSTCCTVLFLLIINSFISYC
jgi:hypothetical protein